MPQEDAEGHANAAVEQQPTSPDPNASRPASDDFTVELHDGTKVTVLSYKEQQDQVGTWRSKGTVLQCELVLKANGDYFLVKWEGTVAELNKQRDSATLRFDITGSSPVLLGVPARPTACAEVLLRSARLTVDNSQGVAAMLAGQRRMEQETNVFEVQEWGDAVLDGEKFQKLERNLVRQLALEPFPPVHSWPSTPPHLQPFTPDTRAQLTELSERLHLYVLLVRGLLAGNNKDVQVRGVAYMIGQQIIDAAIVIKLKAVNAKALTLYKTKREANIPREAAIAAALKGETVKADSSYLSQHATLRRETPAVANTSSPVGVGNAAIAQPNARSGQGKSEKRQPTDSDPPSPRSVPRAPTAKTTGKPEGGKGRVGRSGGEHSPTGGGSNATLGGAGRSSSRDGNKGPVQEGRVQQLQLDRKPSRGGFGKASRTGEGVERLDVDRGYAGRVVSPGAHRVDQPMATVTGKAASGAPRLGMGYTVVRQLPLPRSAAVQLPATGALPLPRSWRGTGDSGEAARPAEPGNSSTLSTAPGSSVVGPSGVRSSGESRLGRGVGSGTIAGHNDGKSRSGRSPQGTTRGLSIEQPIDPVVKHSPTDAVTGGQAVVTPVENHGSQERQQRQRQRQQQHRQQQHVAVGASVGGFNGGDGGHPGLPPRVLREGSPRPSYPKPPPRGDTGRVEPSGREFGKPVGGMPSGSNLGHDRVDSERLPSVRESKLAPADVSIPDHGLANVTLHRVENRNGSPNGHLPDHVLQTPRVRASEDHRQPQRPLPGLPEGTSTTGPLRGRRSTPDHSGRAKASPHGQPGTAPPAGTDVVASGEGQRHRSASKGGFHQSGGRISGAVVTRNEAGPSAPRGLPSPARVGGTASGSTAGVTETGNVDSGESRSRSNHRGSEEGGAGSELSQYQEGSAVLADRPKGAPQSSGVQGKARVVGPTANLHRREEVGNGSRGRRDGVNSERGGPVKQMLSATFPVRMQERGVPFYDDETGGLEVGLPVLSSAEGGTTVVKLPGRRMKLGGTTTNNNLVLARQTTNRIDLRKLYEDAPELRGMLSLIMNPESFIDLFVRDRLLGVVPARPLSRGMGQHVAPLIAFDAAETVRFANAERVPDWLQSQFLQGWIKLHLVPKKSGEGRLIANAIPINTLQVAPPDMHLPRVHDVISTVLRQEWAGQTDGVSYFCQFELHPSVRPFFKAKLVGKRGTMHRLQLKRLPMGWKFAPAIAQHTSNFLVRDLGVAWVDNFIITGSSPAQYQDNRAAFLQRLRDYNVEVDDEGMEGSTTIRVIGLELDLQKKLYRMDPDWIVRRTPAWTEYIEAIGREDPISLRATLEFFGAMIWATYARAVPLWMHAEAMAVLSQAAKLGTDYDQLHTVPRYAREDMIRWKDDVVRNEWRTQPAASQAERDHYLFSDASNTGGAFVEIVNSVIKAKGAWKTENPHHIFVEECRALATGAAHAVDRLAPLYCTDNRPLHWCLVKGHSTSYPVNCMLRKTFGANKPKSAWIPTNLNPVDSWSRGKYEGLDWTLTQKAIAHADAWGDASRRVSEANATCEESVLVADAKQTTMSVV